MCIHMPPSSYTSLPALPIPPTICRDVDGASPFSRGSSWPRDQTKFAASQADSLTSALPGKPMDRTRDCHIEWSMPQFLTYYFNTFLKGHTFPSSLFFCLFVCLLLCDIFQVVVAVLSVVSSCASPWTVARQASSSFTISRSLLKLMSTESVMPSNPLTLCCPLLLLPSIFPASGSFWGKIQQKSHPQDPE